MGPRRPAAGQQRARARAGREQLHHPRLGALSKLLNQLTLMGVWRRASGTTTATADRCPATLRQPPGAAQHRVRPLRADRRDRRPLLRGRPALPAGRGHPLHRAGRPQRPAADPAAARHDAHGHRLPRRVDRARHLRRGPGDPRGRARRPRHRDAPPGAPPRARRAGRRGADRPTASATARWPPRAPTPRAANRLYRVEIDGRPATSARRRSAGRRTTRPPSSA